MGLDFKRVFSLIQASFDNRTKSKRVNPHGVLTWL